VTAAWTITWSHGSAEIQPLGGMLGPVWYALPSGRKVQPFFVAPWVDEPGAADLPGLLRGLRGEWPCVPFGAERDMAIAGWEGAGPAIGDGAPHGHGSNHAWHLIDRGPDWIEIGIDYPDGHPIRRLRRKIAGRAGAAALDLELGIEAALGIDLGLALHPTFRLPDAAGAAQVEVTGMTGGLSFPVPLDATGQAAPGQWFATLDAVPGRRQPVVDFTHQPFAAPNEDLLQVQAGGGCARLLNLDEGWAARIDYDPAVFPSVMLWVSNRGWTGYPWAGRTRALGIEPARAAFDLGQAVSADPANPLASAGIATSWPLRAQERFTTTYALSVEDLA
jgi:hypothetical protein